MSQQSYDLLGWLLSQRATRWATWPPSAMTSSTNWWSRWWAPNNPAEAVTTQYAYDALGRCTRSTWTPTGCT
ncbi:MAG: hypothetical protein R2911_28425 [Caldilineaceae bacterium]